jgi:hypothetical protein
VSTDLLVRMTALLQGAEGMATSPDATAAIKDAQLRLHEPLRVAIAGRVKAGKSTLLNALVGEELAPTDAGECTTIVTWYRNGITYRVLLHPKDGPAQQRPFERRAGSLEIDLGHFAAQDVDHLEVWWPSRRLAEVTLIDTPGIASLTTAVSARTVQALADDEQPRAADAVIYLMRHMHNRDLHFLDAFQEDDVAHGSTVNTVGVLSRADEVGACRLDAMYTAARVAHRYQSDERLRKICPLVVPVAGLLAVAGATLREEEFRWLAQLSGLPADDLAGLLISVDRFVRQDERITVASGSRGRLLDRLGLYGVRVAISLIRQGIVRNSAELSLQLTRRSGLSHLQGVLASQFLQRSRILKVRSAVSVVESVLRTGDVRDEALLRSQLEELVAGTHEFEEIRVLHLLASERLRVPDDVIVELTRLVGGAGYAPHQRLALASDSEPLAVRQSALEALERWRRRGAHPLASRDVRWAADVAARSCEGLISETSTVDADGSLTA